MEWSSRVPRSESLRIWVYWTAVRVPWTLWSLPKPFLEMHPQTIKCPPPCLTWALIFFSWNSSPGLLLQYWTPSEPNLLILVSSENITDPHSSAPHFSWSIAQFFLAFLCCLVRKNFFWHLWSWRPWLMSILWTVDTERWGNSFFCRSVASFASPELMAWVTLWMSWSENFFGQPDFGRGVYGSMFSFIFCLRQATVVWWQPVFLANSVELRSHSGSVSIQACVFGEV